MKLPIFFENSQIPVILSYVSPIEIGAISLGIFVFSRGVMSDGTKMHETIHYKQYLELGFVGFLILYPAFWFMNLASGLSGAEAYFQIPFEIEAYANQHDPDYMKKRKNFSWLAFI